MSCALGITEKRVPYLEFNGRNNELRMRMMLDPEKSDRPRLHLLNSDEFARVGWK